MGGGNDLKENRRAQWRQADKKTKYNEGSKIFRRASTIPATRKSGKGKEPKTSIRITPLGKHKTRKKGNSPIGVRLRRKKGTKTSRNRAVCERKSKKGKLWGGWRP